MAVHATCPNAEVLERFVLGLLPRPECDDVEAHLGRCPTCSGRLETVPGDDSLVQTLREAGLATPPPDPIVRELVERVSRLNDPSRHVSAASGPPTVPPPPPFLSPPQRPDELGRLGGYRVLRVLGEGGMGIVFEAEDERLHRRLALKVIKPAALADPEARARFLREARSVAALEHDNIIPIYQAGEDNGVQFLALPLLKGETLADRIRRLPRPDLREAIRVGRQVAEGLAAAHAAGLVHRDVKPANLWLERRGDDAPSWSRVKVLDFGLARPVDDAGVLTSYGAVVGTPAYMPPEQARGDPSDARSDLFSLGVILYEMTTGTRPFPGNNAMEVLANLLTHEPAPPRSVNGAVPAALSQLIVRLLSKDPAARPPSAAAVAAELALLETPSAPPAPTPTRAPRRGLTAAAAVVLLAGVAASAVLLRGGGAGTQSSPAHADARPPARQDPATPPPAQAPPVAAGQTPAPEPAPPERPPAPPAPAAPPAALAEAARAVLKQYCHRCHHGTGSDGGEFDVLRHADLVQPGDSGKALVVAGQPAESYLYERMAIRKGGKSDMPPAKVPERPADADRAAVRAWIEAGAPTFPDAPPRPHVATKDVLAAVRDDLRAAAPEARPFLRYFTLAHLHNDPRVPDADLRLLRAALAKAVNSLSWKPAIVVPRAVDRAETVLAVDVRKLDWDRDDRWRLVLRAYPYGLRYADSRDADLRALDDEVGRESGCGLAVVRADWFVATATRPPLYHELLDLPRTAGELERTLDVDVAANFRRDELARAGFVQSGVSGQNRLVERHEARYGAYWKSYDFKAGNPRENLMRFPLGPAFQGNPFADQAFAHDGGEIIFHLPNGLQGYLLVDSTDQRIDSGPIAVVGDALKTSGTNEIVTGLSCMACHKHGLISFADQVRTGTAVAGEARRKVERLYPETGPMNARVQEDASRFLAALEKAAGPFLKAGADAGKDLRAFAEPVGESARLYRLADLDLTTAACELDLARPDDLRALIAGNRKLFEYGLAPLLQPGGAIKRGDWERVGATSLMQRVAREIGKGSPIHVTR